MQEHADRYGLLLYKNIRRSGYARVSRSTITDTEIQVGKFVVGQPEGTDERIEEGQVPEGLRFPAMFRGEGVRGHRFHVFDEPRYVFSIDVSQGLSLTILIDTSHNCPLRKMKDVVLHGIDFGARYAWYVCMYGL